MSVRNLIVLISVLLLVACSTTRFTGISQTSPKLRTDTIATLLPYFQAVTQCDKASDVVADIPSLPPFMKKQGVRVFPDEPLAERWVLRGCGKEQAFDVDFTPDGSGGAYINVTVAADTP